MILNALSTLLKFFIGAVAVGALLSAFDITAEEVLRDIALVLIPIWLVIFLLKPPGFRR